METHIDFAAISRLFEKAQGDHRKYLYEHEVYDLIRHSGSETPPAYYVLAKNGRPQKDQIDALPGEKVVIKIISPYLMHKSDVGGVRIIEKNQAEILSTVRRMYYEIPAAFRALYQQGKLDLPEDLLGVDAEQLERKIADSIVGVILCQYMHPDSHEFGNELLVSLRQTREFGMIISAGLGGTDTELYAKRFKKGQAVVAASTEMVDGEGFFELFRQTISYKKLAGLTRGQQRIVTDEQLLECFSAVIELGNYFSPLNDEAPFIINELEINPFAFSNYLMLPLDGLCSFASNNKSWENRPVEQIENLLCPKTIAIAGASSKKMNIGRIILQNIVNMGFASEQISIIHPTAPEIDGIATISDLSDLPAKVDLLVLAVKSAAIPALVEQVVSSDLAETVILVPGSIGAENDQELQLRKMQDMLHEKRQHNGSAPIFLGGNSLGVFSRPGSYDALFIPESKLPKSRGDYTRKSALVSQSGAYMITRMSRLSFLDPAYAVSIGNQVDLTVGDFLHYFRKTEDLETLAFYIEGFADYDGLRFSQGVRAAIPAGKEIVFYKAGRTAEGKTAMAGHTASIAGDYMVCESCVGQAGAFVAETFSEFEGLLCLSRALHHKEIRGNRLAALSNAGYEAVGIADNILGEDYSLKLAEYSPTTFKAVESVLARAGLSSLVKTTNPVDVTPMATEAVYGDIIHILLDDEDVDVIVVAIVPLTPILHTLPDEHIADDPDSNAIGIVDRMASLNKQSEKPLVMVVDSGPLYDHMANALEEKGLPVFRSADQAVRVLGKYVQKRLMLQKLRNESQKRRHGIS